MTAALQSHLASEAITGALPPRETSYTIKANELAELLGITYTWLLRNRQRYEAAGMPPPLPHTRFVWSRKLMLAWIDGSGSAAAARPTAAEAASAALDAHFGGSG